MFDTPSPSLTLEVINEHSNKNHENNTIKIQSKSCLHNEFFGELGQGYYYIVKSIYRTHVYVTCCVANV